MRERIRGGAAALAMAFVAVTLAACGPTGAESVDVGAPGATAPPASPPPVVVTPPPAPPVPPPSGNSNTQRQIGSWSERILNADGTINQAEYRAVANSYNAEATLQYRLGPTAADFGFTDQPARLWGPDPTEYGLWPSGILPANNPGEPEKCVRSENLPRSDQEARARGMEGPGWLFGGAHAFVPDDPNHPDLRFGVGNTSGGDGVVFEPSGGLCMRMRARWYNDWWTRNNIAAPANPQIRTLAGQRPDLPLVPVAIARGRANANQISFAAFRDGTIAPMVIGNSAPERFDPTPVQLPAGMVPTALAVTPYNEFLVVTVWDTNTVSGKLAFIALRPRQMALGSPTQTPNTRWYWGLPGAWTNLGMKLLGFVDLPMAAPTSVDVSNHVVLGNPRGNSDNDNPAFGDLSRQSARDLWRGVSPYYEIQNFWRQSAQAGYAVVASRAEDLVTFVDMGPLYRYYREMYLTTQANFNRTVDSSTTDPQKWPFTFAVEPRQRPLVSTSIRVDQPTSVSAGIQTTTIAGIDRSTWFGESGTPGWSPNENWPGYPTPISPERIFARRRAFVASMDGTVRIFDVAGLNFPNAPNAGTVPSTPIGSFQVGRNPTFGFTNGLSTAPDDLFLVSRGDRSITFAFPNGQIQGVLRDSRLVDPVGVAVSLNQSGFGGSGPGRAASAHTLSVVDFNGKQILTYAVERRRGAPHPEQWPFTTPSGPSLFLFGSAAPFPGKPFMIDNEEII